MTEEEAVQTFLDHAREILQVDIQRLKIIAEILYLRGKSAGADYMVEVYKEHNKKHDK